MLPVLPPFRVLSRIPIPDFSPLNSLSLSRLTKHASPQIDSFQCPAAEKARPWSNLQSRAIGSRSKTVLCWRSFGRSLRQAQDAQSGFCQHLWAESAVRKILRSAWGSITVPISRPSMTTLQACAISFWVFTRCARTAGIAEVMDAMEETSSVRSRPVTFSPLR